MPSLKDYRDRIASVKSTRKITSAMKMVAASKLKRAQRQAEASQPYAERMASMLVRLIANTEINEASPVLLAGTGSTKTHLLVVVTSDRGLCGGFNSYIIRDVRNKIQALKAEDKIVKLICIGTKGRDLLKGAYQDDIVTCFAGPGKKGLSFADADEVSSLILDMLGRKEFDVCTLLYNEFQNVITQIPSEQQIIPFQFSEKEMEKAESAVEEMASPELKCLYEFEPNEEQILQDILPRNLGVQLFRALLDSAAGEQAARMTAMDNATRNAGEKINDMTLTYNRARQAYITSELIEIISGAEAV